MREWNRWNEGGRRGETDPRMRPVLADYWRRGPGLTFADAQLANPRFQADHPWSAAFISWVMRQAGAGDAFRYSATHASYISAAKQNRTSNPSNPFQAYRPSEVRLAPGDIVCKSRGGSGATYDNIRPGMKTHCDVVVAVSPTQVTVVGGNVDNSVSRRTLPVSNGFLASREHFAVIKVGGAARVAPAPGPSPLPAPGPTPGPRPSGRVENTAIGRTYYAAIDLGIRTAEGAVQAQTGIFRPAAWTPTSSVDLVIYLHGIRDPRITIDSYWNAARHPHFALREEVAASGKNVLLVAPLLGPRSQSQIGLLARPGGLDQFVASVLAFLRSQREIGADARLGRIVLACHSGGGLAMRTIALAQNKLRTAIQECWGFDCTYNHDDATVWPRFAAQGRLFLYYLPGTQTARQALLIQGRGVPNVSVVASRARNHNWVPRTHLPERLRASALQNVPGQFRKSA
jgi:hypothetical protein